MQKEVEDYFTQMFLEKLATIYLAKIVVGLEANK